MTCCRMDGFVRWCQCAPDREEHMAAAYRSCVHHPEHPDYLRTWLLEQIAEDERVAREVSAVELAGAIIPGTNGGVGPRWDAKDGMVFAEGITWDGTAEGFQGTMLWDARDRRETASFAAVHMARWDPARVLAECDAKRRIIEHLQEVAGYVGEWCGRCSFDETPTLKLLALPYRDREGYREEWKP